VTQENRPAGVPLWIFGLLALLVVLLILTFTGQQSAAGEAAQNATALAEVAQDATQGADAIATTGAQSAADVEATLTALQSNAEAQALDVQGQSLATVTANAELYNAMLQTPLAEATKQAETNATQQAEFQATIAAGADALAVAQAQANVGIGRALDAESRIALENIADYPLALLLGVQSSKFTADDASLSGSSLWTALDARPEIAGFMNGHSDDVYAIAYSPDGKLLATGGGDSSIFLWDVATRQRVGLTLAEHSGSIFSLVFSPDGATLASAGSDGQILLWDVATGERKEPRLSGHTGVVESLAFSPDGTMLASAGDDATIRLWDVSTGKQIGDNLFGTNGGIYYSVAFSPDGSGLAAGLQDGTIQLWNVSERIIARTFSNEHYQAVYGLAFSPDGKSLASAGYDQQVVVWNVRDGLKRFDPIYDGAGVTSVQFSPDGKELLTVGAQVTLTDISGEFPTTIKSLDLTGFYLYKAIYGPDGQTIAITAGPNVILWNPDAIGRLTLTLDAQTEAVRSVAFSQDGAAVASASQDGSLTLWDAASGATLWRYDDPSGYGWLSAAFSPDGTKLVAGNEDGNLYIFDAVAGGEPSQTLAGHTNWVMSVAYSQDGTKIASGSSDSSIILWDAESGEAIGAPLTGQNGDIWAVAFSPDGKTLASASNDPTVWLWDVETHQAIGEPLTGHTESIYALAFSPDNKLLATGGRDTTAILWDTATWQQVAQLAGGHTDSLFSVTFSPDSKTLATGSADGTITLWDTTTYQPISEPFATEPDWVDSLAFSPDGTMLAAGLGSVDGVANQTVLLQLNAPDVPQTACLIAGRNLTWEEWKRYVGDESYQRTCADWPVHYSVIEALGRDANVALQSGDTDAAEQLYARAAEWAIGSGAARSSNDVCWYGSLNGYAETVMPACDYAVENAPASANYIDSRGLARALTDDTEGAIADFQVFVDWTRVYGVYDDSGILREEWITQLSAGQNPFDEATLDALRAN
jgi:WD40 repeat protein